MDELEARVPLDMHLTFGGTNHQSIFTCNLAALAMAKNKAPKVRLESGVILHFCIKFGDNIRQDFFIMV